MARKWFQLKREDGSDLTLADAVFVDIEDVAAFRDAVKEKFNDSHLKGIASSDLKVATNGVALDSRASLVGIDENETLIVQVPQRAGIELSTPAIELLQVILPHILANPPTTLTERDDTFKERLCDYYGCFRRKTTWVRCMLLDVAFPRSLVIASHLFRRSNEYLSLAMMQIADIDDAKNGLLLFKPLEHALDHFQISFIRDDLDVFRLKLFDPSIKDTRIIDLKDRKGHNVLTTEQRGVLLNSVSGAKKACTFDVATTFGDMVGKPLVFTGLERPFYRCLNLQARVARMIALKKKRIDAAYDFEDFWTEVSLDDKMEMFHQSIMNAHEKRLGLSIAQHRYTRSADVVVRGLYGYSTEIFVRHAQPGLKRDLVSWPEPPAFVTLWLGGNDSALPTGFEAALHVPIAKYRANLREIVQGIRDEAPETAILMITPPAVNDAARLEVWSDGELDFSNDGVMEYARACIEVAKAVKVPVLDFQTIMNELGDQERHACQYDGLHFNVKGHALVAEKLFATIEREFPTVAKRLDAWEHPDYLELIDSNADSKNEQ